MNDQLRKALAQKIDADIMAAITGGATTANTASEEPFTLDKLRRMMLALPPKETLLSSKLFPVDRAWIVKGSGENFTCAHPAFWMRFEDHLRKSAEVRPPSNNPLGMTLTPIEIDPWDGCGEPGDPDYMPPDRPERAAWRRDHWRRLAEALRVAMAPLPDWLRGAPEFGEDA